MESQNIFLTDASIKSHLEQQQNHYDQYIASYVLLTRKYNKVLSIKKKAQILAVSMHRSDSVFSKYLMKGCDLPTILKTCAILDARRLHAVMEKKLKKLENKKRITIHKSIMANVALLNDGMHLSLTNSKSKFIKDNWIIGLSDTDLEYNVIQYPIDVWKKLISYLHLKPTDFQIPWFTGYVFEGRSPDNSMINECKSADQNNICHIIKKYKLPYGYVKTTYGNLINEQVIRELAEYVDLNDIVKDWHTFDIPSVYEKIFYRMEKEKLTMPYGELMKRIQDFSDTKEINQQLMDRLIGLASTELTNYDIRIEQPVVVFGDASASMDVAIRTSSIIMSILCSICSARMHLFNDTDHMIESPPRSVQDVIRMGKECKASNSTAPVASLHPYLQNKEIVKTFIIVTDEEENTDIDDKWIYSDSDTSFASVFKEYYQTVYQAKLVFISFLPNGLDGPMVRALKQLIPGIEKNIIQFRLNDAKPDLRKLDGLLDMLTMDTGLFDSDLRTIAEKIKGVPITDKLVMCNQYADTQHVESYEPHDIIITI
jgi:hypothetical protein